MKELPAICFFCKYWEYQEGAAIGRPTKKPGMKTYGKCTAPGFDKGTSGLTSCVATDVNGNILFKSKAGTIE